MRARAERIGRPSLVACSLWLHIGFIGASALAAGLLQLFDGEAKWSFALALAFSGAVLAAASWRRGLIVLERADRDQTSLPMHSPPSPAVEPTRNARRLP